MADLATAERFWVKVNKDGPIPEHRPDLGPCWLWTAHCRPQGYGQFWDGDRDISAHVWPWEQKHGPIPKGLEFDHLCRNPPCVRDDHLEAVTHQVNCLRGATRQNGAEQRAKTHCPIGHPYDAGNTYSYRGKRGCRTCRNAQAKQWKQRQHAA